MPKYSLKRLLFVVTVIACVIGFLRAAYVHFSHFETAENLAHVDWLPESASNVSYYKSYSFTAYEFDISESDFKRWARWNLEEIKEPVTVDRYPLLTKRGLAQNPNPADPYLREFDQEYENCSAQVSRGLFHEHRRSNGGGVSVAFNRDTGRA